jgi:hypothetical protein
MKLKPAQKELTALANRCRAPGMSTGVLPKRLPVGLAVPFGEHPFPQPCWEVHPRRPPL